MHFRRNGRALVVPGAGRSTDRSPHPFGNADGLVARTGTAGWGTFSCCPAPAATRSSVPPGSSRVRGFRTTRLARRPHSSARQIRVNHSSEIGFVSIWQSVKLYVVRRSSRKPRMVVRQVRDRDALLPLVGPELSEQLGGPAVGPARAAKPQAVRVTFVQKRLNFVVSGRATTNRSLAACAFDG